MSRTAITTHIPRFSSERKIVLYVDFDGTITKKDVLNYLLKKHASSDWLLLDKLYLNGKISSSICIKKQLRLLKDTSLKQLLSTAKEVSIDNNFIDLIDLCKKHDLKIEILSDGLDVYIKHLLRTNGVDLRKIKIRCNNYIKKNKSVNFPYKKKLCNTGCANCKPIHLNKKCFKIYIGDGKSDECVAQKSDLIFAKDHLSKHLSSKKINYIHFNNFKDVIKKLFVLNILT